jgi:DNA-binding XRE family transcriptional regulator
MLVKTSDLTPGEKLVIQRRRDGTSQVKAAKKAKVSLFVYRQWEQDVEKPTTVPKVGKLEDHEQCYVMRRRAGWTAQELADELEVCRWWLCQMERGQQDTQPLVDFWQAA